MVVSRPWYILSSAKTPADAVREIETLGADQLARVFVNDALNRLISEHDNADIYSALAGKAGEAAVPYQGWYWRSVDFFAEHGVTIARGDGKVAVCENNKWDYPDRSLTDDERAEFLSLVWDAYKVSCKGGNVADINRATHDALVKAGEFISNLEVEDER